MRFLSDQDVYQVTVEFLRAAGHSVVTASEAGLARASDEALLRHAAAAGRILLTRDKGYGSLVYARADEHSGVALLRMDPQSASLVHEELGRLIREHSEAELGQCFVTVEPKGHRIRRIPRRGE